MICPLLKGDCAGEECAWWDGWVHFDETGAEREGCCSIRYLSYLETDFTVEVEPDGD